MPCKAYGINVYAFLLLIGLCQFNLQTQPGTLRGSRKTFSLPVGESLSQGTLDIFEDVNASD